jgi:hypothetical protein
MVSEFHIVLSIKTPKSLEDFARFIIGNNRDFAENIFNKLTGRTEVNEKDVLYINLIETKEGLPFNLYMITCTLNELAENCRIITKEVFKLSALEDLHE